MIVAILFCILYTFTCLWCHTHWCMQMKPRFSPVLGSGLRHFSILPQHSCRIIPYTKKSKFLNRLAKDFLVGFTPGYPSGEARSLLLDRNQGLIRFSKYQVLCWRPGIRQYTGSFAFTAHYYHHARHAVLLHLFLVADNYSNNSPE